MASTSKGIIYPTSSSLIAPLETHFANLASTTNDALGAINASTDITAGSLPIARGGTGASTAGAALTALGALDNTGSFFAGKNKIINGAFDFWQRGTSFTSPSSQTYLADRWQFAYDGTSATRVISQQPFTAGAAPVAGYEGQFFYRYAQTVAGTSGTFSNILVQPIEDVRTFAGQTVTVSFWAKVDATRNLTIVFQQFFGTGGTPSATTTTNPTQWYKDGIAVTAGASFAASTAWARYSTTVTLPSISGKTLGTNANTHYLSFVIQSATVNATQTVDIWGVQVEGGSAVTPFSRAGSSWQAELALCQRYYYKNFPGVSGAPLANGFSTVTGTAAQAYIPFPSPLRIAPTAIASTATVADLAVTNGAGTAVALSAVPTFHSATTYGCRFVCNTAAGLTAGQGAFVLTNSANGYIAFNAEY